MSEWSVSTTQTRVIVKYDEESPVSSGMQHVSMKWAQRLRGLSWRAGSFWAAYLEIHRLCSWAARNKPPPTYLIKTRIFFYWFRRTELQFPLTDKNSIWHRREPAELHRGLMSWSWPKPILRDIKQRLASSISCWRHLWVISNNAKLAVS